MGFFLRDDHDPRPPIFPGAWRRFRNRITPDEANAMLRSMGGIEHDWHQRENARRKLIAIRESDR